MKKILVLVVVLAVLCGISGDVFSAAKYVIFEWDLHPEKIAGYRLYQSNKPADYYIIDDDPNNFSVYWDTDKMVGEIPHDPNDVENSTRYIIYNLPMGTYYWVLSAFTVDGRESGPSNEVTATIDPSSPGTLRVRIYYH